MVWKENDDIPMTTRNRMVQIYSDDYTDDLDGLGRVGEARGGIGQGGECT